MASLTATCGLFVACVGTAAQLGDGFVGVGAAAAVPGGRKLNAANVSGWR